MINISVESGSASNPDEFQDLHRKQEELDDSIKKVILGKNGIQAHEANISSLVQKVRTKLFLCDKLIETWLLTQSCHFYLTHII